MLQRNINEGSKDIGGMGGAPLGRRVGDVDFLKLALGIFTGQAPP